MTVQELIHQLQHYPAELRIVLAGYEGGFNDIQQLELLTLQLNAHPEWYYGAHEKSKNNQGEPALALLGENTQATITWPN